MSNEISRVYQFLSQQGDWVSKTDKNGDGIITKDEFRKFMEDFDWDGENISAQNDLINKFWAKVDTNNVNTLISGTNLSNKNALDSREIASMESKIEMYDTLNNFISTLNCPSVVAGSAKAWKEDVSAELQALLDKYAAEGGTNENLMTYLETESVAIQNKVTAEYCAAEYLDKVMPELNKEYGYTFGSDEDLNNLIQNYTENLPEDVSPESMKDDLINIIDAYLAAAGLSENKNADLYTQDNNAPLNDLQKCVAESTLKANLEAIKEDANYEQFADTIDAAVTSFIENALAGANAGNYQEILGYGIEELKQTDAYRNIQTTLDIKKVMIFEDSTSALYQAIEKEFGTTIADILTEGVYFDAYETIMNEAIEKVDKFTTDNKLDTDALIEWVVAEIKENLNEILVQSDSSDALTTEELYELYTESANSADAMGFTDSDKALRMHKDAAISYCEGIAAKGTEHEKLLEEIFESTNYVSVINSCIKPSQIEKYIEEIQKEVGNVKETVEVAVKDQSETIINDINNSLTYKGTNVSSARTSLAFRIEKDGSITFVGNNYDEINGIWDDAKDKELDDLINNQIRTKIQEQYAEELSGLNLTESEKDNLFNIALFMTLSDTTVVKSMYDEMNIGTVIEEIVNNYSEMLVKISTDENARKYIKNVENKSLLNGMTTLSDRVAGSINLGKYYTDDSTPMSGEAGDDWVSINGRKEEAQNVGGATGNIILLATSDANDDAPVNSAMKAMLTDYVNTYNDVIEPAKIIELFREAQQTAFTKLESVKNQSSADGSAIYGYGESNTSSTENYDTYRNDGYYGVNSILINIMYEMERLISKEIMGM